MKEEWALDLRDKCFEANVEFFFKQWGGFRPKFGGRLLDGRHYDGFPWHLMSKDLAEITKSKFE